MIESETKSSIRPRSAVVVAGMHRSGTSLAAGMLSAHGIRMGTDTLPADRHNQAGYFEDVAFLELQSQMLWDATAADDGGHRDWGWTEHEQLDRSAFDRHLEAANDLIQRRSREAGTTPWGWKNPRTTLQLDFWDRLLGHPQYLLLYRYPWEVADSMQRLGAEVFLRHPEYSYRIWEFYNRQLLAFKARVGDRAVVVGASAIVANPAKFEELVNHRFPSGSETRPSAPNVQSTLFRTAPVPIALVGILGSVRPECLALLRELEGVADLPCGFPPAPTPKRRSRPPQPRLSIIIPCYNHGEFLIEAVASAEAGGDAGTTETLIVNDGSTEPWTLTVLDRLRTLGFTILDVPHGGLSRARNLAATAAHGTYLLPLDADNRIRPGFLAAAMATLDTRPDVGVVYSDRCDFGLRSSEVTVPDFNLPSLLLGNYIDACAVFRRQVWQQCHGWDAEMLGWDDWDFWITVAEQNWQFVHWPGIGFDYRVRPDSLVTQTARAGPRLQEYLVRKHESTYRRLLPDLVEIAQEHVRAQQQARAEAAALRHQFAASQTQQAELSGSAATMQGRLTTLESSLRSLQDERDGLTAERERLASDAQRESEALRQSSAAATDALAASEAARHQLSEQLRAAGAERVLLDEERRRLNEELAAWRQRLAAAESTTAWRLRTWLLNARRLLGL